jgi:hypothetical protein
LTTKVNKRYQQYQQQLTAKSTIYGDPGSYSKFDNTARLDEHILFVYKSTSDPDKMYLHEALKAHDELDFKKELPNEIQKKIKRNNW